MTMKRKTIVAVLLSAMMSVSYAAPATGSTASTADEYGIDTQYRPEYKNAGCNELAWTQISNEYRSQMNTYKAVTSKMDEQTIKDTVNPDKFKWEGFENCFGNAGQLIEQARQAFNSIKGLGSMFSKDVMTAVIKGAIDQLQERAIEKLQNIACKATSNVINKALDRSGVPYLIGQASEISKDPFNMANKALGSKIGNVGDLQGMVDGKIDSLLKR